MHVVITELTNTNRFVMSSLMQSPSIVVPFDIRCNFIEHLSQFHPTSVVVTSNICHNFVQCPSYFCPMFIAVSSKVCHNSVQCPSQFRLTSNNFRQMFINFCLTSVRPLPSIDICLSPFILINALYSSNPTYVSNIIFLKLYVLRTYVANTLFFKPYVVLELCS